MIAQFRILLPYAMDLLHGDSILPYKFRTGAYEVTLFPPYQAAIKWEDLDLTYRAVMPTEIFHGLLPSNPVITSSTFMVNGTPTVPVNALTIEFQKSDFHRENMGDNIAEMTLGDPPPQLALDIANSFLIGLRTMSRAYQITPLYLIQNSAGNCVWRLQYLTDDRSELEQSPGYFRGRMGLPRKFDACVIDSEVMGQVSNLIPTYVPPAWSTLILDAESLLPAIGPALILAATAIETMVEDLLTRLAPLTLIPTELWTWINNRDNRWKEPTTDEQMGILFEVVTGRSLKNEPNLWEAYKNIKAARNSYVHQGQASIGKHAVSAVKARDLVVKAKLSTLLSRKREGGKVNCLAYSADDREPDPEP